MFLETKINFCFTRIISIHILSYTLELVSKELNHLVAILHAFDFYEKKTIFQTEKGKTFKLLVIFIVKSL